jgi:hypothetical protein
VTLPVLGVSVFALSTACAPYHAGAAATIGDDRIDTATLRTATAHVLADQTSGGTTPNDTQVQVQQTVLTQLVELQLLQRQAVAMGVSVGPSNIGDERTALIAQILTSEGSTVAPAQQQAAASAYAAGRGIDLDELAAVQAYVSALSSAQNVSDAAVTAVFDQSSDHHFYDVDEFTTTDVSTAQSVATALQSHSVTFAQVQAQEGPTAAFKTTVTAAFLEQGTSGAAPTVGQVVGLNDNGTYEIFVVTGTGTETLADALAPNSSERATAAAEAFAAGYKATAAKLSVHINPRFGSWSPTAEDVLGDLPLGAVQGAGVQLSSPLASPSATTSAGAGG